MKILTAEVYSPTELSSIPHGKHLGKWHGYEVHVTIDGKDYRMQAAGGIRGWCDCVVTVDESGVTVECVKNE